jgi:hypothetical protein
VLQHRKSTIPLLIVLVGGLLLAACASSNPIDTSAPTTFTHRTGVFSLQVPKAWKQTQDEVPTESIAAFSDPGDRAELIAYTGLLDRRLTADEGQQIVASLVKNLLNAPGDLQITDQQRQPDGAFTAALSFTRANEKRSGTAIFRDDQLALAGVILSGPAEGWADFQKAMQPSLDSFKVNPDFVQGTYFAAVEDDLYALAAPADWTSQPGTNSKKLRSPDGQLQIIAARKPEEKPLNTSDLAEAGRILLQENLAAGIITSTEQLPDGRVKVLIRRNQNTTVGYLDQKDGFVIGLFFDVPTGRVQDYQPFIDFVYSTFITGKL